MQAQYNSIPYVHIHWIMAGSTTVVMPIQTVMLSERVPVLLTRLTVTNPSLSLTSTLAVSNSIVTIGGITGQTKVHQIKPSNFSYKAYFM